MNSFLVALIFAASFSCAYRCSKRFMGLRPGPAFPLIVLILWSLWLIVPVQLVAALQLAGAMRRLTVANVAVTQLVIASCLVAGSRFFRKSSAEVASDVASHEAPPRYLKISAGILAGSYALFTVATITGYPGGSDALVYHLPVALRWLQEGSLRIPELRPWRASMPGNAEILMMLMLSTGRQALVVAGNWISLAVLLISVYVLAWRFGNKSRIAAYSVLLIVLSIPIVEFQTFSAYVDLFGTAFILAAFALFLQRYDPEYGSRNGGLSLAAISLSALACGLSLGTKLTFCAYGGVYFVVVAATLWRERKMHHRSVALLLGLVIGGMLLPSIFWYAREYQATGNPLYPSQVVIGGRVLLPGADAFGPDADARLLRDETFTSNFGDHEFVRRPAEWWIYPWTEWVRTPGEFPSAYGEAAGLGGGFAAFAVIGVGFACFLSFQKSTSREISVELGWSLLICLILLLAWVFALHRLVRFGLPIWIFFCVLAAPLLELLRKGYPRLFSILFMASILTTCGISSLVPLHELAGTALGSRWSRAAFYAYPPIIDELPPGACLLNDSQFPEKNFVLAGKHLTNRVVGAHEAPRELTASYLSSYGVDYIVRIAVDNHQGGGPEPLPSSVAATEILHRAQAGRVWSIWKVTRE